LLAINALNRPLSREGFEAFYGEDELLYIRHIGTKTISTAVNPHRPFTPKEIERREQLDHYLDYCSEDELIKDVLLPLFRQLGFHRITAAGHKDKALEYGKDIWMRFHLSKGNNANVAEILNQVHMMLGHEIFDPETNTRVLVDHAFIVAGGEITKQAKNWLGGQLDASKRSQILFMDREDILNIYITSSLPLPADAIPRTTPENDDSIPF
jgi:hypothetical protein